MSMFKTNKKIESLSKLREDVKNSQMKNLEKKHINQNKNSLDGLKAKGREQREKKSVSLKIEQ